MLRPYVCSLFTAHLFHGRPPMIELHRGSIDRRTRGGSFMRAVPGGVVGRASHTKVLKTRGLAVTGEGGSEQSTSTSIWTCS